MCTHTVLFCTLPITAIIYYLDKDELPDFNLTVKTMMLTGVRGNGKNIGFKGRMLRFKTDSATYQPCDFE